MIKVLEKNKIQKEEKLSIAKTTKCCFSCGYEKSSINLSEKLKLGFKFNVINQENLAQKNPLGGNVYKKRVAKIGHGKSGSTRTILAFKIDNKAFFIHGFSKKDKDNISDKELEYLKFYANILLNFNDAQIEKALKNSELMEVIYE